MKKARLVKAGTAEVIYRERADAQMAVKKYHQRELDGESRGCERRGKKRRSLQITCLQMNRCCLV